MILPKTLIAIMCNDTLVFFFVCFSFSFCSPACTLSVNNSVGLIDVAYRDALHCLWTIGNVGIANTVAVFIIQRVIISSCRYLELTVLFFLGLFCSIMSEKQRMRIITTFAPIYAIFKVHFTRLFHLKTYSRPRNAFYC